MDNQSSRWLSLAEKRSVQSMARLVALESRGNLSKEWRLELFRAYLVDKSPIPIDGPGDWLDIVDTLLALVREDFGFKETRYQLLEEARNIFYMENRFVVSINYLSTFLDDIFGIWAYDMDPVETLIRKLTIQIPRHTSGGSDLQEYLITVAYFAHWSRLEEVSFALINGPESSVFENLNVVEL